MIALLYERLSFYLETAPVVLSEEIFTDKMGMPETLEARIRRILRLCEQDLHDHFEIDNPKGIWTLWEETAPYIWW